MHDRVDVEVSCSSRRGLRKARDGNEMDWTWPPTFRRDVC